MPGGRCRTPGVALPQTLLPMPMSVDPQVLDERVRQAWHVLCTDPLGVRQAAAAIAALSDTDPAVQGHAALFDARGRLSEGDRAGCDVALARAEDWFRAGTDPDGPWACTDLRVMLLTREQRYAEALVLLAPALAALPRLRSPVLRHFLLKRHAGVLEQRGSLEEALRAHQASLASARDCGLPSALALALALLGGLHASELNHEDALPLCEEAWGLCEPQWAGMVSWVGPNLMMALSGTGRHDEAAGLAGLLLEAEPRLLRYQRDRRLFLVGICFARAGRAGEAQHCLDRGMAARDPAAPHRAEWVWAQAGLWNGAGRFADALGLVEDYLRRGPQPQNGPDYAIDLASLHHEAAHAHEGLGAWRAALDHARRAAAHREQALARASQVRRLSLQITMELDAARRARDEALRGQQRLTELNSALNAANEAKGRFLAAASHDLRQPVHALALQAAALRLELSTPRQLEMLAGIERCAGALGGLFDALLDLSRMDAGALQPQRQRVDLGALLLRLVDEQAALARAKGLRLAVRVTGAAAPAADSDPALLEAMLRNLIGNAIKYTAAGTVLVCARAWQAGSARPQWRLQVWDTGIGLDAGQAAQVFDEFYQVDNPARRRAQGLGLGLAIVRRLAVLLDHPVSLRSVPGRGSCFELRVPAAPPRAAEVSPEPPVAERLGLHVVVIEDDPEVAASMRSLLQQWGCRVTLGDSADAVLGALGPAPADGPHAVLVDLRLPGPLDGVQELQRLRERLGRTVPALLLTGDVAAPTLALLAQAGLPWLPKPAPVHRLAAWLAGVGGDPVGDRVAVSGGSAASGPD